MEEEKHSEQHIKEGCAKPLEQKQLSEIEIAPGDDKELVETTENQVLQEKIRPRSESKPNTLKIDFTTSRIKVVSGDLYECGDLTDESKRVFIDPLTDCVIK